MKKERNDDNKKIHRYRSFYLLWINSNDNDFCVIIPRTEFDRDMFNVFVFCRQTSYPLIRNKSCCDGYLISKLDFILW